MSKNIVCRYAKLVETYLQRFTAVIAAKGGLIQGTEYKYMPHVFVFVKNV